MTAVVHVDENPLLRDALSVALEAKGFRVSSFADARGAWKHLGERGADLVLLDIGLAEGSGLTLLGRIHDDPHFAAVPVVLLTDCRDPDVIRRAAAHRPRKLLLKSATGLSRLLEVLREVAGITEPAAASTEATEAAGAPTEPAPSADGDMSDAEAEAALAALGIFGDASDDAADAEPALTAEELEQMQAILSRRETATLIAGCRPLEPTTAPVARAVRAATSVAASDARIVGALELDADLAARVAAIAAADRGDAEPPAADPAALVREYGPQRLREALMVACVFERFAGAGEDLVPPGPFWCHVLAVARLARDLAESHEQVSPTDAFAAGLLHDLGRLVLAETARSAYGSLTSLATRAQVPLEELEERLLGMSHAEVVAELVEHWVFGRDLAPVLKMHHAPRTQLEQLEPPQVPLAQVLALADRLAHAHLAGDPRHDRLAATEDFARALHLDASHAARAGDGLDAWIAAMADAASRGRIRPESAEAALQEALGTEPLHAVMFPQDAMGDASRVCLHRMLEAAGGSLLDPAAGDDGDPAPQVAVIRQRGRGGIDEPLTALRDAEPAPLPLLVLADDPQTADRLAVDDRPVAVLTLPVRALDLARTLAELRAAAATNPQPESAAVPAAAA